MARLLRAVVVAALSLAAVLVAAPAHAASITRVAAGGYRLHADWSDDALATRLRAANHPTTLTALLHDLDHRTGACDRSQRSALPPAHVTTYFCWDAVDSMTQKWTPQGITGSFDAALSGRFEGQVFTAVSWYSHTGQGVRISFVDAARTAYRSVLLVDPTAGGGFRPVLAHAAGISFAGHYLYVTDMRSGIRVFDVDKLMTVSSVKSSYGYRYVLPQVARYTNSGSPLEYSSLALDRSTSPDTMVVSEYDRSQGALVVSFPVDHDSRRLATNGYGTVDAMRAVRLPVTNVQGATTFGGVYYLGTSNGTAHADGWAGPAGRAPHRTVWAIGGEDLYHAGGDTTPGLLWSLTEHARCDWSGASCGRHPSGRRLDMRIVFAVPASAMR